VNIIGETKHELSNCWNIIEIFERIKRPEVKKESKDRIPESHLSGSYTKSPTGASFGKEAKVSNSAKKLYHKYLECFKCHKKENNGNKCPMQRLKTRKAFSSSGS